MDGFALHYKSEFDVRVKDFRLMDAMARIKALDREHEAMREMIKELSDKGLLERAVKNGLFNR